MDPQKLSQLDPKLRDAYQRVMGTPIPQVQTQPIQAQTPPPPPGQPSPTPDPIPTPTPMPEPEPTPMPTPTPTIQEPPVAPFEPPATPTPIQEPAIPQQPPAQASNFVQMNSEVAATVAPQSQTIAIKKKNGMMMPILFGIVGIIFIAVYTLFWTKIFNFQLPF